MKLSSDQRASEAILLRTKVDEYVYLKKTLDNIKPRIEKLSKEIKDAIFKEEQEAGKEVHPGDTIQRSIGGCYVEIQAKQVNRKVDEGALEQLLIEKHLWERAVRVQLDLDYVRHLYLEEQLTDEDLRSIGGGTDIQLALTKVEPECTKE